MYVKMLNPKSDETMIDPASGFRVIIMTEANSYDGYMNFIDSTKF